VIYNSGKPWETLATAKGDEEGDGVMAPQGFSGGRSAEIVVFQSFLKSMTR
jgi:hypothetical protein